MIPVLTAALRTCRVKALRKGFGSDNVTPDEVATFENCVSKYFEMSKYAEQGTKDALNVM